jgi:organic hydroperoxide reductase OsmC/OhrA
MLIGAICACNMTTFDFFAQRLKLSFSRYESECWALAEHDGNSYRFTQVKLKVKVTVPDESQKQVALDAIDKAHRYCLVSNSLKAKVEVEPEVIVGE